MSERDPRTKHEPQWRVGGLVDVAPTQIDARGDGTASTTDDADRPVQVHAEGLFPGERGQLRLLQLAKRARPARWYGRTQSVDLPHPARREAPCEHHISRPQGRCAGCPLMPLEIDAQLELKAARIRALGLELSHFVRAPKEFGYRMSAKRVVGGRRGALDLGSHVRDGHRVAPMHACRVDHPLIVAAAERVRRLADEEGVEAWRGPRPGRDEAPTGDLRYVWFKTDGHQVLITLISGDEESHAAHALPEILMEDSTIAGVAHSVQDDEGNAIRGEAARVLAGRDHLAFHFAGEAKPVQIGPLGFLQPNPEVAAMAYEALLSQPPSASTELDEPGPADPAAGKRVEWIPIEGEFAVDLYAGAGLTTRRLRSRFGRVEVSENYPESAAALGVEPRSASELVSELSSELADGASGRVDVVVANPPRGGLDAETRKGLRALAPERVHIMSCNPETLARDLAELDADYTLDRLWAFDTLPQTAHVELVAWLRRRS